jgi:hypothetical protein
MLPFVFVATQDDPGFSIKAGQLVVLDLSNAEIPIAAVRPLGRNYGRVLNLVELGILVDVNQDQDLTPLRQVAGAEQPPPPAARRRSPFPRRRRHLGILP